MRFGKEEHLIKMSYGYIENDKIVITEGSMKDYEGIIKRIDRHKRKAVIEIEFFGRIMDVSVELEIVKKIYEKKNLISGYLEPINEYGGCARC